MSRKAIEQWKQSFDQVGVSGVNALEEDSYGGSNDETGTEEGWPSLGP